MGRVLKMPVNAAQIYDVLQFPSITATAIRGDANSKHPSGGAGRTITQSRQFAIGSLPKFAENPKGICRRHNFFDSTHPNLRMAKLRGQRLETLCRP